MKSKTLLSPTKPQIHNCFSIVAHFLHLKLGVSTTALYWQETPIMHLSHCSFMKQYPHYSALSLLFLLLTAGSVLSVLI